MNLNIVQNRELESLLWLYGLFLFLVALGMFLNKFKRPGTGNIGKAKAGIREKFLVFVVFQAIIYALAWAGGPGFASLLAVFGVLIAREYFLNFRHIFSLPVAGSLRVSVFFFFHGFSLWCWWLLARQLGPGLFLPFVFLMLATGDSYAQITGELAGGPKLAPRISPNKTWSGFLLGGGVMAVSGLGFQRAFPVVPAITEGVFLWGLIWVGSAFGDLWASSIKRRMGISDFSGIMGASGGMLDRIDSYVFIAPLLILFLQF